MDGIPCANINGIASVEYSRDEKGFRSERRYLDPEGRLYQNSEGVAIYRWRHDEFGRELERSYYGTDGELTSFREYDYAKITTEYTDNDDLIIKYYGPDGNPVEFFGAATEHRIHAPDRTMTVIRYDINGDEI